MSKIVVCNVTVGESRSSRLLHYRSILMCGIYCIPYFEHNILVMRAVT